MRPGSSLRRASILGKRARRKSKRRQARRALKLSHANGMASFRRAGRRATATVSCGGLKGMYSRGSASGPLSRSKRPSYWPCCAGSRAGVRWKPPTAPSRTAGRFSAMPWRPAGPSAIRRPIYAARCPYRKKSTMPRSSNQSVSAHYCVRSMAMKDFLPRSAHYGSHRWCSCGLENCAGGSGRRSIWKRASGASLPSA